MEQIDGSETSACKNQKPVIHPISEFVIFGLLVEKETSTDALLTGLTGSISFDDLSSGYFPGV
jgi:hypothetical protein